MQYKVNTLDDIFQIVSNAKQSPIEFGVYIADRITAVEFLYENKIIINALEADDSLETIVAQVAISNPMAILPLPINEHSEVYTIMEKFLLVKFRSVPCERYSLSFVRIGDNPYWVDVILKCHIRIHEEIVVYKKSIGIHIENTKQMYFSKDHFLFMLSRGFSEIQNSYLRDKSEYVV